jgi:hypothetical protein
MQYLKQVPPNAVGKRYSYTKVLHILDTLLSCLLPACRVQLEHCIHVNYICIFDMQWASYFVICASIDL